MSSTFEVRFGRQTVARRTASSAQEALTDYLHGLGYRNDEIVRLGVDVASWRGATYRAVPADAEVARPRPHKAA